MDVAVSVKLLVLTMGVSFIGVLGSILYKVSLFFQFKRMDRESRQLFSMVKAKINHILQHGEDKTVKEEKSLALSKDDARKVKVLLQDVDAMIREDRLDDAERHLVEALGIHPDSEDANSLLAFIYMKQEKFSKAESLYLHLVELGSQDPAVFANLGKVLEEQENYVTAVEAYREAIVKDPHAAKRYVSLAEVYKKMEKSDVAVPLLEEAVRLDSESLTTLYALAEAYEKVGDESKLIESLKVILQKVPEEERAKEWLSTLRS